MTLSGRKSKLTNKPIYFYANTCNNKKRKEQRRELTIYDVFKIVIGRRTD